MGSQEWMKRLTCYRGVRLTSSPGVGMGVLDVLDVLE